MPSMLLSNQSEPQGTVSPEAPMALCPRHFPAVALVDCNNFYASCERLFAPQWIGRPVLVLSNNDGCVIARSSEAKAFGVPMGAPFYQVKHLAQRHAMGVFSANFPLYGDLSQRVMSLIGAASSQVEFYSVDEAFLSTTHWPEHAVIPALQQLRQQIGQWVGIPVSIGVAPTKTLAKLATEWAKNTPNLGGVYGVWGDGLGLDHNINTLLSRFSVGEVWGVGRRLSKALARAGIQTALDLKQADEDWVIRKFSVVLGRTVLELRGIPCLALVDAPNPKHAILTSRSFGTPIEDWTRLRQAVAGYTAKAAEKMRGEQLVASAIQVFIRTNPFRSGLPQYAPSATLTLECPLDETPDLLVYAEKALSSIYRPGYPYHKAGVMLLGLIPRSGRQRGLFDEVDRGKRAQLMTILDALNHTWGTETLRFGAEGLGARWRMRQEHRSPRYTTAWKDLCTVQI